MSARERAETPPRDEHLARKTRYEARAAQIEAHLGRLALVSLALFVASGAVAFGAVSDRDAGLGVLGALLFGAFVASYLTNIRWSKGRDDASARAAIHDRHLARIEGRAGTLPTAPATIVRPDHAYAHDVDLVGPGSLLQRLDVTHTAVGEGTLVDWLTSPADTATIQRRQEAVAELAGDLDFRESLEAAAALARGKDKLDHRPFLLFTEHAPIVAGRPFIAALLFGSPIGLIATGAAAMLGLLDPAVPGAFLAAHVVAIVVTSRRTGAVFDLVAARRGYVEAFARVLATIEGATFRAPLLVELRKATFVDGAPPSAVLASLDRWAGFAELRSQFPLHLVANLVGLWDLHVLAGLERWTRRTGPRLRHVFDAIGALEALASLATFAHQEPGASYPEIGDAGTPFEADALAHPLLLADARVANDVHLGGDGTALLVTGSNMAGKSTLLRAVGLAIALALAGGPVLARRMRLPAVRLRASMRAEDSLARGASYFHAELVKLRVVVGEAEARPAIFFLLDELLRGTNERARHVGARSVILHLLERGATGLVATHDVALATLEETLGGRVRNAHFTDVMEGDEMVFDYKLRDGVVKTSNALALLRMAGVDIA